MVNRLLCDAVICAKDEAPRIAPVIAAARAANCLRNILIVDDGSTDATAAVARRAGANVLSLAPNRGKGAAMLAGFRACRGAQAIAFLDADLTGLRPDHVCALVRAVAEDGCGQACGLRDSGDALRNALGPGMPIITGERVVRADLLARLPLKYWSGFVIEVAINEIIARSGLPTCTVLFDGVNHAMRYAKRGETEGLRQLHQMTLDILGAMTAMRSERF